MRWRRPLVFVAVFAATIMANGCDRPQDLPVVVSRAPESERLQWRDAYGPLRGEVPWVLRTDVLGPDTFLVVETDDGETCAESVSFRVLAGGVTEYTVRLVSDLSGNVSWRITYGANKKLKLFTCRPRPADDPRQGCIRGGIPKPLFGELIGDMTAELVNGGGVVQARELRFEQGFPCGGEASGTIDREHPSVGDAVPPGS